MSGELAVLIVLTSTALRSLQAPQTETKRAVLKKFGQCKGLATLPVLFHDVAILPDPKTREKSLSFKVTIREQINEKFIITLSFSRCDSSGNPDSCEFIFKDFNVTNVCEIMQLKNELWSEFMAHFNLPLRCPIRAGTYKMTNCPINTEFLKYIPMPDALYKVKLIGWDGGKKAACVEVEQQILTCYSKSRNCN